LSGEFRRIDPGRARIVLVEGADRLLQAMPQSLSSSARRQLEALRVEVRTGSRVTHIDAMGVTLQVGAQAVRIDSRCMVWGAGVAASPLGRMLADSIGIEADRAGRVPVLADLSLPGHPEISVIGDLAQAQSHRAGAAPSVVPGVSPAAKQMGRAAAANVLRRLRGQPTRPFRYSDWGNLATIGRHSAVVDLWTPLGRFRFSGIFAWMFWLFAHIYFLIGFRNRLVVLLDWATAYWSSQRYARVVADIDDAPPPTQPKAPATWANTITGRRWRGLIGAVSPRSRSGRACKIPPAPVPRESAAHPRPGRRTHPEKVFHEPQVRHRRPAQCR
jgi:NADH dehydrogenase